MGASFCFSVLGAHGLFYGEKAGGFLRSCFVRRHAPPAPSGQARCLESEADDPPSVRATVALHYIFWKFAIRFSATCSLEAICWIQQPCPHPFASTVSSRGPARRRQMDGIEYSRSGRTALAAGPGTKRNPLPSFPVGKTKNDFPVL